MATPSAWRSRPRRRASVSTARRSLVPSTSTTPRSCITASDQVDDERRRCPGRVITNDPLELTAEAAQKPQLVLECWRGVWASGDCNHERCGHPGGIHRERLLEDVLVVGAVRGDRRPSLRIWTPRAVVQDKRGKVVFAWAAARG